LALNGGKGLFKTAIRRAARRWLLREPEREQLTDREAAGPPGRIERPALLEAGADAIDCPPRPEATQIHQPVREVTDHLEAILDKIDSGVVAVGPGGRITLVNAAASRLAGLPATALVGREVTDLPAPLARMLDTTPSEGSRPSPVEITLLDGAGRLVPVLCSTALVGPRGPGVSAVAVFTDVTKLKQLEEERRRAERMVSIEAIAAGLAHEIRNPLTSVKAYTQLLPERHMESAFRERSVRVTLRALGRIEDLLARFRTLAEPAYGSLEPTDVAELLQTALETLGPQLEARGVTVSWIASGRLPVILGRPSLLHQLFHNLCVNAVEAMTEGGELTIRLADLGAAGGVLRVDIADSGSGIPDELLESIFNPFVTSKPTGTGLGLAICRSIADAHRATLTARNNAGRPGATFTVEFPIPARQPAPVDT
jgi:PAS domain S-box-containing protein